MWKEERSSLMNRVDREGRRGDEKEMRKRGERKEIERKVKRKRLEKGESRSKQ